MGSFTLWFCALTNTNRRTVPFIMVCWGIVVISMAFVKSFAGLLVYVTDPSSNRLSRPLTLLSAAPASSWEPLKQASSRYLMLRNIPALTLSRFSGGILPWGDVLSVHVVPADPTSTAYQYFVGHVGAGRCLRWAFGVRDRKDGRVSSYYSSLVRSWFRPTTCDRIRGLAGWSWIVRAFPQ